MRKIVSILCLSIFLALTTSARSEEKVSVSPRIALWTYQIVTVRLTVRLDNGCDEYLIVWGDGSRSGTTDCGRVIIREHDYKWPDEFHIVVLIRLGEKVRRLEVTFLLK